MAVCTLSNRDLPHRLTTAGEPALAIAGRCETENIGIEKVILNLLANPRIRWLVICGEDAKDVRLKVRTNNRVQVPIGQRH